MPKVDISKVPVKSGSFYPAPFQAAHQGRHKQAFGDVVGLTQFGVNICAHRGRRNPPRCVIGTSRKTSSSTCSKASWC